MPNAELSSRRCDHCGVVGALLQCGSCKQVAYCNFNCQRVAWKEHKVHCGKAPAVAATPPAPAPPTRLTPSWTEHQQAVRSQLPRPSLKMGSLGAKPAKIEDFFDREDLDCGLAPVRDKKPGQNVRNGDPLNYSKWDNLDSDDTKRPGKPQPVAGSARPPMFGQAMGVAPARQASKSQEVTDTRTPAEKRADARKALDEVENLLHQVAGEVLYQAGFMGHGSVWELGPAAEKVARKGLRLLDSKVLPVLPSDPLATFLDGSTNFFLRRAMDCTDAEKRNFSSAAKGLLLEVYRDPELNEEYRENACDFLCALLHEEGKPKQAEEVARGAFLTEHQSFRGGS